MDDKPELIYFGDPMCSWCWGVSPTIEYLAKRTDISLRLVAGGLRVGERVKRLDDDLRKSMADGWAKVGRISGQPFDTAFLDREEWDFNSELPSIAVTTMRSRAADETVRFFAHLQASFYRDGIDITDRARYPSLVAGFPGDAGAFLAEIDSEEARARAWDDFAERKRLGVEVLPTVLLDYEGKMQKLAAGYFDIDHFENQLAYWVEGRQPDSASIGTCSLVGGDC